MGCEETMFASVLCHTADLMKEVRRLQNQLKDTESENAKLKNAIKRLISGLGYAWSRARDKDPTLVPFEMFSSVEEAKEVLHEPEDE